MLNVIFDLDGVIFDSERIIIDCWKIVGEKHDLNNVDEVSKKCIGTNDNESLRILEEYYHDRELVAQCRKETFDLYSEYCKKNTLKIKTGVNVILPYLKKIGANVAVATSTQTETAKAELESAGLLAYFDYVIGGDQVSKSKPAPDIFLYTASEMGVSPEDCFVIEDSYNGILAASCAQMHPIMVPDLLPPNIEMYRTAEEIHNSLYETCNFFKNINFLMKR